MHVNRLRRFVVQCPKKDVEALRSDLGSLCEMMRTHIASIVLVSAVLTAASFLAPFARATDYLMPDTPVDKTPTLPGSLTNQFMTYGVDSDGTMIPVKTLRITNNNPDTVYPILRDPNDTALAHDESTGLYDPYDEVNKEYRGYIGYQGADGKYYFGLGSGDSILVSIPLVFWNGGRIGIATDGTYLTSEVPNAHPYNWDSNSQRTITDAESSKDTITNGVVMWYRAETATGPADDAQDQLAEFTIRDHDYLVNPKITERTKSEIPDNQLVTLINYDISNVDTLYLPLAFAANDVWVVPQSVKPPPNNDNRNGWIAGSDPDVYGWTGAINDETFLQGKIKAFTKDNQLLGQYFGTNGWPYYNVPNATNVKIPGGANIFAESPLKGVVSSYNNGTWQSNQYMLSSGGTTAVFVPTGAAAGGDPKGSTILHLVNVTPDDKARIAAIQVNDIVVGHPPTDMHGHPTQTNPIQDGTSVLAVDTDAGTVTLSQELVATSENCSFDFYRPLDDYASDAMIKLWFSWAQYYLKHWNDDTPGAPVDPKIIRASIDAETATLTFKDTDPHPELVEGMAVMGPGLDDALTEGDLPHQGDAVILEIAGDKKSVTLSQVANKSSSNAQFKFLPPEQNPLIYTPVKGAPGFPLIDLDKIKFSGVPDWHDPYNFSQKVYLIMASMNQIGELNNDSVSKYMQDIVGANMGYIFDQAGKDSADGQMVIAMIRDMIKSVLRGVTDFTKFPDVIDAQGNHRWYPDPKVGTGGQAFNVFNLDPFVRFVHVELGFTGYGFSVDDDVGDIGAGGASHLQLTVTGTGGLKNTNQWTIQAPYGPVGPVKLYYSGPASLPGSGGNIGATVYTDIVGATNSAPITVKSKDRVHLSEGDTVLIDGVVGNKAANGTFTVRNVGTYTFDLYHYPNGSPVVGTGNYEFGGRWSPPLHAFINSGDLTKVFYRVAPDDPNGTFLGTFVKAGDVVENPNTKVKFRVWALGPEKDGTGQDIGQLILWKDLTDASGNPLGTGTYDFTFYEITP